MKVYQTDQEGFFVGKTYADPDPLDSDNWIIPGGAVTVEPPTLSGGQLARWLDGSWTVVEPEPEPEPAPEPEPTQGELRALINTERTHRLAQGTTIDVTGYGSVAVQGRDQDQITVLALEASARDLTAAGVTGPVIPFRDRDNVQHMLTPEQTMELMRKAKAFAQQIYQASWALKDADPVPLDYDDDKHWP